MNDHLVIDFAEVCAMALSMPDCSSCQSSHGIHVSEGEWDLVLLHDPECDQIDRPGTPRLTSIHGGAV